MKSLQEYINEVLDGSRMKYNGKNSKFADIIIENEKGEILILRRANYMKNFRTCWGLVGGTVDKNDKNTVETIVRETREETGIEIDAAQQLKLKPIFSHNFENGNTTDIYYIKLETTPEVKLSKEHSKYEWIRFDKEKIDDRKWVPETFNILQKWEQKPMNEKLQINTGYDYHTIYEIDNIISNNVNFDERLHNKKNSNEPQSINEINLYLRNAMSSHGYDRNNINREFARYDICKKVENLYKDHDKNNIYMFLIGSKDCKSIIGNSRIVSKSVKNITYDIINNLEKFDVNYIYKSTRVNAYYITGIIYTYFFCGGDRYGFVMIIEN